MPDEIRTNRWVSGDVAVYYWIDRDGELRLTDKSAVKLGCEIKATYQNIDAIPQDVIDQIISHNKLADNIKGIVQLTAHRVAHKYKITDKVRTGKSSNIIQKPPSVTSSIKNNDSSMLFTSNTHKNTPFVVVKLYDGSQHWVEGVIKQPLYGTYWYDFRGILDPDVVKRNRVVNNEFKTGHFVRDKIEIVENPIGPPYPPPYPYTWGEMTNGVKIRTNAYYHSNSSLTWESPYADSRDHWSYFGTTYEDVTATLYEDRFDAVLLAGSLNTYNKQLDETYLANLDIGVKLTDGVVCLLTQSKTSNSNNTSNFAPICTFPADAKSDKINGVVGLYDMHGQPYNRDATANYPWSVNYIGAAQYFSGTSDSILHLAFKDEFHTHFDFNTSDTNNFCMSRTRGDWTNNVDLIIPKNDSPTIEVILIPKKWKYFVWLMGMFPKYVEGEGPQTLKDQNNTMIASTRTDWFGNTQTGYVTEADGWSANPTWITHEFSGSAPDKYGNAYGRCPIYDPECRTELVWYNRWEGAYGQGLNYTRYGHIATPEGRLYGPYFGDAQIENEVLSSYTFQYKCGINKSGQRSRYDWSWVNYYEPFVTPPGYQAWACPPKEGQLVAILRVLYSHGAVDYRYVYSKTNNTEDPTLQAHQQMHISPMGCKVTQMTPESFVSGYIWKYYHTYNGIWMYSIPAFGGVGFEMTFVKPIPITSSTPTVERHIDPYYVALYKKLSAENLHKKSFDMVY